MDRQTSSSIAVFFSEYAPKPAKPEADGRNKIQAWKVSEKNYVNQLLIHPAFLHFRP
jgi:hypothetical protein